MGIQGLLPELRNVEQLRHIRDYAGWRAAVDASSWLHASLVSFALELARGEAVTAHVDFCLSRIALLEQHNIEVLLVFDGSQLRAKEPTNVERRQRRKEKRAEGFRFSEAGDMTAARKSFAQGLEVTPEIVASLAKALSERHIPFVIAPYEADAQLAHLSREDYVDVCISEDSDLLAFGCKRVLFKMDRQGAGKEILLEDVLQGLSFEEFQATCVLIGCDYLPRLPRMGPKTAFRLVWQAHERWEGPHTLLEEVYSNVQDAMPEHYPQGFAAACLLFRHQTVLDIETGQSVSLQPLPPPLAEDPPLELLGPPQEMSRVVASVTEAIHAVNDAPSSPQFTTMDVCASLLNPDMAVTHRKRACSGDCATGLLQIENESKLEECVAVPECPRNISQTQSPFISEDWTFSRSRPSLQQSASLEAFWQRLSSTSRPAALDMARWAPARQNHLRPQTTKAVPLWHAMLQEGRRRGRVRKYGVKKEQPAPLLHPPSAPGPRKPRQRCPFSFPDSVGSSLLLEEDQEHPGC